MSQRIFVSYSHHDAPEVEGLIAELRVAGLDVVFDGDVQLPQGPTEQWRQWMQDQMRAATWVLVVCSDSYRDAYDRRGDGDGGEGATFESNLIADQIILRKMRNDRFIPILLGDAPVSNILEPLLGSTPYRIPQDFEKLATALGAAKALDRDPSLVALSRSALAASRILPAYLQQTAADRNRPVPYFQHRVEPDLLDRVYVNLELGADGAVTKKPLSRPLGLREVLTQSKEEHPWITGKWVVLGDPGSGKTTLLNTLAVELAKDPAAPWIPVVDSLPRLLKDGEWLFDRVVQRLRTGGVRTAEAAASILDREGKEGKLLVLLDGLDEVPKERRDDAESLLHRLLERWPHTPVVVTSRPIGYHRPHPDFRELDLLPLDDSRRLEFLARWFGRHEGTRDAKRAKLELDSLDEDLNLKELSRNPLYLMLLALLREEGTALQHNRNALYEQVFKLLLSGKRGREWTPQPLENGQAALSALQYLAFGLTRENRDAEPQSALVARLYEPEADRWRKPLHQVPQWRESLFRFLDDVASRTGILGPDDGPEADWRFWHRTFREALAARELARRWKEGGAEAILACAREISGDESRWAEPYALLAGSVDDPDALIRALVDQNRALGVRALATAQGVQRQTILEVLELATEDAIERGSVIQRIPDLLGDGERAVLLLDRLRRDTTNGNDLFFLALAARRISKQFPDYSRMAGDLVARLYDHIPKPPESAFRQVVTGLDGTVDLWRPIQPGSFWMGSTGLRGASNEYPRHHVTIGSRFSITVVPITNGQYALFDPAKAFATAKGIPESELEHHPRVSVNWYEAVAFCQWLADCFPWAKGARLPLEEEWEYVCRAGTESAYWNGNDAASLAHVGWFEYNADDRTHAIGEKPPNPWGLYDVHGNVAEWVLNPAKNYSEQPVSVDNRQPFSSWENRTDNFVLRGGCYWDPPHRCRAAWRFVREEGRGLEVDGFRVVIPDDADD